MAEERGKSILSRVPPQNNDAEIAVLCCCLDAPDRVPLITGYLLAEDFYVPAHQKIYETIYTLYSQSKTVDLITVGDALKKQGDLEKVGGMEYLSTITDARALVSNLSDYVRIVKQKSLGRRLIRALDEVSRQTYEGESDPSNLLEVAISRLSELRDHNASDSALVSISKIFEASAKGFLDGKKEKAVMSHFSMLDYVTNGFRPGTLSIVAARPSMGKSAFVINIAVNVALYEKVPVAFFSLEMNAQEIANRILAARGDLPISVLQSNRKPDPEMIGRIGDTMKIFNKVDLYIDEQSGLNSAEILTHCRELQNRINKPLGLICIDYLQLMSAVSSKSNASRQQEVSEISRSLKLMAKELKVPIIALAQLSRESEKRDDHRPMLSDLRDSGAIEQDADMVMFIHRPDYYKRKEEIDDDSDEESNEKPKFKKNLDDEEIQKAEIIVAKNRQGPTKTIYLQWNGSRTVFFEKDKPNPNQPLGPSDEDAPPEGALKSVAIPQELFEEPAAAQDAMAKALLSGASSVGAGAPSAVDVPWDQSAPAAPAAQEPSEPVHFESDPVLDSLGLEPIAADMVPGLAPAEDLSGQAPDDIAGQAAGDDFSGFAPPDDLSGLTPPPEDISGLTPPPPGDDEIPMGLGVTEEESQMGFEPMATIDWDDHGSGDDDDDDDEPDEPEDGSWFDGPGESGDEE